MEGGVAGGEEVCYHLPREAEDGEVEEGKGEGWEKSRVGVVEFEESEEGGEPVREQSVVG